MDAHPDAWGIDASWSDAFGTRHDVAPGTLRHLRRAMGADEHPDGPPTVWDTWVVRRGAPEPLMGPVELHLEDGTVTTADGQLPVDLPLGYHTLLHELGETRLVVSPGRAFPPPTEPRWGLSVQGYAARSSASWGIGDLADLRRLSTWGGARGAALLLTSPLGASNLVEPYDPSPYFPSSRRFLDPVHLRIEDVPGAGRADLGDLATAGRALNADPRIDRRRVAELKLTALHRIWRAKPDAGREPGFSRFVHERDPALTTFARHVLLTEQFGGGWSSWPAAYHDPAGDAVEHLAATHRDRVRFHAWVQWLLDLQLAEAGAATQLMGDLPVGFDPDGADAWAWQDVLAPDVTIGAPPDPLGPAGQNWLLPPFVPWRLRAAGYEPFVQTVRAALRHVEALRVDHVLGLFRLFWIPRGATPADGSYVHYPASDLLDILALESHRAGTWVVGEDLGTVPTGLREEMAARDLLRYQVLLFEDAPPEQWSPHALASATTHDLPTLSGLWTGSDLEDQRAAGLDPDERLRTDVRRRMVEQAGTSPDASARRAVVDAHRLLGRSAARVVVGQVEDLVGIERRANVPGTSAAERANWSVAWPEPLEDLLGAADASPQLTALHRDGDHAG